MLELTRQEQMDLQMALSSVADIKLARIGNGEAEDNGRREVFFEDTSGDTYQATGVLKGILKAITLGNENPMIPDFVKEQGIKLFEAVEIILRKIETEEAELNA